MFTVECSNLGKVNGVENMNNYKDEIKLILHTLILFTIVSFNATEANASETPNLTETVEITEDPVSGTEPSATTDTISEDRIENVSDEPIASDESTSENSIVPTTIIEPSPTTEDTSGDGAIFVPEDNVTESENLPAEITIESPPVNAAPSVIIASPTDGFFYVQGDLIQLNAAVVDDNDSTVNVIWRSSIEGELGSGNLISTETLSVGIHTITAIATDSQGLIGIAEVVLTVTQPIPSSSTPITPSDDGTAVVIPDDNATPDEIAPDVTEEPISNTAPSITISTPTNGATIVQGESIMFSGTAVDNEDGSLDITWTSSIAGELGMETIS